MKCDNCGKEIDPKKEGYVVSDDRVLCYGCHFKQQG